MEPLDLGIVKREGTLPTLLALLERPGRKAIASAFIGSDSATLLRTLGNGDLLVGNASDAALQQGSTNPSALRAQA